MNPPQHNWTPKPKRLTRQGNYTKDETKPALTQEQIDEKLTKYVETFNIDSVGISTHIRYSVWDKDKNDYVFRTGGLLYMKKPEFVVLNNGNVTWSVPKAITDATGIVHPTHFWRIMNQTELKDKQFSTTKTTLEQKNDELMKMIEEYKAKLSATETPK